MKKRALIVDDDETIRTMVRAILEAEGYQVIAAADGAQGVSIVDKEPAPVNFDVIVLDVMMPGMNGLDVLTRLKLHSRTRDIPVLMLTAEAKPEDVLKGYEQGAEVYITKPFTRQQLLWGLEQVLPSAEM